MPLNAEETIKYAAHRQRSAVTQVYLGVGIKVIQQVLVVLSNCSVWRNPQGILPDRQSLLHVIQLCLNACQIGQQACNQAPV